MAVSVLTHPTPSETWFTDQARTAAAAVEAEAAEAAVVHPTYSEIWFTGQARAALASI